MKSFEKRMVVWVGFKALYNNPGEYLISQGKSIKTNPTLGKWPFPKSSSGTLYYSEVHRFKVGYNALSRWVPSKFKVFFYLYVSIQS